MEPKQDQLVSELTQLADDLSPDAQFVTELEMQLRRGDVANIQAFPGRDRSKMVTRIAAVVVLAVVITLITPLRNVAQDIIDDLFPQADSDTRTHFVGSDDQSSALPQRDPLNDVEIAALDEELSAFSFEVSQHGVLLPETVTVEPSGAFTLEYQMPGRFIYIARSAFGSGPTLYRAEVGASAEIITVEIDNGDGVLVGQYVEGDWIMRCRPDDPASCDIDESVVWLNDAAARRLRWVNDGWLYEIIAMGGGEGGPRYIGLDDMVEIAERLTQSAL